MNQISVNSENNKTDSFTEWIYLFSYFHCFAKSHFRKFLPLRSRSTKKPFHRFVLLFGWSLSLLSATEWCNKNIWLHAWFSRETLLKMADFFLRFYVASRESDKNVLFFWHKRTFLDNWSTDCFRKSNIFSWVVPDSRYTTTRSDQWYWWVKKGRVCKNNAVWHAIIS